MAMCCKTHSFCVNWMNSVKNPSYKRWPYLFEENVTAEDYKQIADKRIQENIHQVVSQGSLPMPMVVSLECSGGEGPERFVAPRMADLVSPKIMK